MKKLVFVTEKMSASRVLAPLVKAHWPEADITFVQLIPFANIRLSYPRGVKLRDLPRIGEAQVKLAEWGEWLLPPWKLVGDDWVQIAMDPKIITSADEIIYACDPDHTGALAFDTFMREVFGDDRAAQCPALMLSSYAEEDIRRAMPRMEPFGQAATDLLKFGRTKRHFDWNWNLHSMIVFGEAMRLAGCPTDAPPLSKFALQLLYALRDDKPLFESGILKLMQDWPGTGKYAPGAGRQVRLGTPTSAMQILRNLEDAQLIERMQVDDSQPWVGMCRISPKGLAFLGLLHPGCRDADLPYRLDAWCAQGEAAKPAMDRYIRTVFGRQMKFKPAG
ncbi:hypothetical protein ABIC83_002446 [Roseateles asaccharophilus]|uniref:hypothetical protein n=1 Tax=Roseateles asaccharophilus TaxID=582607 RepID=UPI003839AE38